MAGLKEIHLFLDPQTLAAATAALEGWGLSLQQAVDLLVGARRPGPGVAFGAAALRAGMGVVDSAAAGGGLPFLPNAETRAAMEEARRGDLESFHSVEVLMADMNADD